MLSCVLYTAAAKQTDSVNVEHCTRQVFCLIRTPSSCPNRIFDLTSCRIGVRRCAAKAFYSCPAIISRRPGSQNTPKESQLNPEEDSRIKQARSHVTLEKSSKRAHKIKDRRPERRRSRVTWKPQEPAGGPPR